MVLRAAVAVAVPKHPQAWKHLSVILVLLMHASNTTPDVHVPHRLISVYCTTCWMSICQVLRPIWRPLDCQTLRNQCLAGFWLASSAAACHLSQ